MRRIRLCERGHRFVTVEVSEDAVQAKLASRILRKDFDRRERMLLVRTDVVKEVRAGASQASVARKYKISRASVWKYLQADAPDLLRPKAEIDLAIEQAVSAVLSGMRKKTASQQFGIDRMTLDKHLRRHPLAKP